MSWNTRQLTLDALQSLQDDLTLHSQLKAEVWVVDNASQDGSAAAIAAQFPQVKLIASPENLGFGRGNNAALRAMGFGEGASTAALPKAVYLLNSDTRSQPGATQSLYDALFRLPQAGVVGAQLSYEDGSFQHSAFAFPGLAQLWIDLLPAPARLYEHRLNGRYPRQLYAAGEAFAVGHTLGATMMLRREVIQQTGMFDEQFHMYAEEVDWSWRIQRAGWKIYCVPAAHVIHLEGRSTRQIRPQSVLNLWQSRLQLYQKYYPPWKRWLAKKLLRWGMARKIRQAAQDHSLAADERAALTQAYQQVRELAR